MKVLDRYLNLTFLRNTAATTIVILAFAMLFDLLDVSDSLLSGDQPVLLAFANYMALRLPGLFAEIFPIATLLAGLFTAAAFLRSSEMVVVWASGVSVLSVMLRLMPAGLLLLVIKFANDDVLVPKSIEALREWGIGGFAQSRLGIGTDYVWFRKQNQIFRMPLGGDGVTVFELAEDGNLAARLDALTLSFEGDQWRLGQITRQSGGQKEAIDELLIDELLPPDKLELLYRPPQELSVWQLSDVILNDGFGAVATERHRIWLYQRLVGAVVPVLLGLLAFALARHFDRRQGAGLLFFKGIGIGFGFIILNGMALALGEAGFVSPALAGGGPILLLAAITFWAPWRQHRQGRAA